ncbi:hypothetical protein JTB14_007330 [Gonioctena quinquepunctata]|nr:hypothetical protein JTB14_007330 [Gonioctena quinquepunctata]
MEVSEKEVFQQFLHTYEDIFAKTGKPLEATKLVKHRIDIGDTAPVYKPPYRVPFQQQPVVRQHIEEMLQEDIIRPSASPSSAPVVLVEKKVKEGEEKKYRFCIDFQGLNAVTQRDFLPIPNIHETLNSLGGAEVFSTLDLSKGYWQIEVEPKDREETAFSVPWGHYECNRMPFGSVNSPATWMRFMYAVLAGLTGSHCFVYLDDIIYFSKKNVHEHVAKLRDIFERKRGAGLTLNPDKCEFMKTETAHLGHLFSENGEPNNRLMRWSLALSEYTFTIQYRPDKEHANVDTLSRVQPIRYLGTEPTLEPIWNRERIRRSQQDDPAVRNITENVLRNNSRDYYLDLLSKERGFPTRRSTGGSNNIVTRDNEDLS